ncbi:MAG TPA: alpha/beta hydrolase [Streptosporangiales bacterium]
MGLLRVAFAGTLTGAVAAGVLATAGWAGHDTAYVPPRDRDHAVVVLGDLRTAERVAVLVPGMGIDRADLGRADQVLGMARSLDAEIHRLRPRARVAIVAWADYPAPSGPDLDVARGGPAREGAKRLSAYLDAVQAETTAPIGLFCHSYGSVVCGLTPHAADVSDVVLYGSPGVRLRHATQFGRGVRVWAARSPNDWIRFVPHVRFGDLGHGRDPVDPAFGARVLPAGGVPSHGGYYASGSQTLRSFAYIAAGDHAAVQVAGGGAR